MKTTPTVRTLGLSALLLSLAGTAAAALPHIEWYATVRGTTNEAIRGDAIMGESSKAGITEVSLSYRGDAATGARPWHVHRGSCAKPGPVFGNGASYKPVMLTGADKYESKAELRIALPDSGDFYVSVHESAANMKTIVACGNMALED